MKKELDLFSIEGSCCGNQDRMTDPWMKLGGCAALAAVDSCLLLTIHCGFTGICPIDPADLSWESYNRFAEVMRPYLSPRMMGVNRLSYFTDGFGAYLRDIGCSCLSMEALPMGIPAEQAASLLIDRIGAGFPVPILHLNAKTDAAKDYRWHWFLLTGCREDEDGLRVKAVTFGEAEWLRFDDLWHADDPENGGLILFRPECPPAQPALVRTAAALICDRQRCPATVLAARSGGDDPYLYFPGTVILPDEDPKAALERELAEKWGLSVTVTGLLAINEYDDPPHRVSARCYKAVLRGAGEDFPPEDSYLVPLTEEALDTARWRPFDLPLINILRSDMTDAEVIRRRIAEEEAGKA